MRGRRVRTLGADDPRRHGRPPEQVPRRGDARRNGSATQPDAKLLIVNCDDLGSSPLGERRGLRSAARRRRDQRDADGAVPVGARRGRDVPRRGRRRAPHAERRVGDLPLGADHPLAEPPRRRRRVPAHGRRRLGPRRPRRGAQGVPGPDRAGDLLGLRRLAPRQPHGHAAAARRVLRRVPRARRRLRPAAAHGRRERRAPDRLPVPAARRRGRRRVPRPLRLHERRFARARSSRRCSTSRPASPRCTCIPAVDTDELRASHPDWANRVEDHALRHQRPVVPPT